MTTINDILSYITQIAFIGLGLLSAVDYLRFQGHVRRDIALMFASLAIPVGISSINTLLSEPLALLSILGSLTLLAQPYLLLRLVNYFRSIPHLIKSGAIIGMVASWLILIGFGSPPPILSVVIVIYFVIIDGFAMVAFVQGALLTSGVVKQRLRFGAAGSGLLALALFWIGLGIALPALETLTVSLIQLTAIASAFTFYLGLAAPQWLLKTWQLRELHYFLLQMNQNSAPKTTADVYNLLQTSILRVTGGNQTNVLLKHNNTSPWTLHNNDGPSISIENIPDIDPYWHKRSAAAIAVNTLSPSSRDTLQLGNAETMYVVPLARQQRAWGLVLVLLEHGSLFVDDDLQILGLFAEQSAIILENIELIEHLRLHAENLQERTIRLTAVNRELEAFSYSVSHDLRAPLRAVDGFSHALLEDYDNVLDDVGRDFLRRIRTESQRMGQLIDDMIGLSRLSRTEMNLENIDLSEIVSQIATDLQAKEPERTVKFSIQNDVKACADKRLIRIALQNLIGNAWKFTSKKPHAYIDFGCTTEAEVTYYIRDNGAGFDMAYVNKLFGAFQRLHAMTDFAGTGIGLATVQRIINRHGGLVRAEGSVDEGATFYFTLKS